jgi:undecaprenyl-diphosphatase
MTLLSAALLGIVEGITEFLPVSSTGHLIIAQKLLNVPATDAVKSFDIAIQLGAILAAVIIYWPMLMNRKLWIPVLAAFLPTAIIGFALHSVVKTYLLGNSTVVILALGIGGVILIGFELLHKEKDATITKAENVSVPQAIVIGLAQAVALIPGVSRSAATVIGGMSLGISRSAIVDFSFLLAIPTMAAATGLDLVKSADSFSSNDLLMLAVGFVLSFITAYVAIKWLLSFVRSHSFVAFGVYRIIVAIALWFFVIR